MDILLAGLKGGEVVAKLDLINLFRNKKKISDIQI
jgi:hypothetical protein